MENFKKNNQLKIKEKTHQTLSSNQFLFTRNWKSIKSSSKRIIVVDAHIIQPGIKKTIDVFMMKIVIIRVGLKSICNTQVHYIHKWQCILIKKPAWWTCFCLQKRECAHLLNFTDRKCVCLSKPFESKMLDYWKKK